MNKRTAIKSASKSAENEEKKIVLQPKRVWPLIVLLLAFAMINIGRKSVMDDGERKRSGVTCNVTE